MRDLLRNRVAVRPSQTLQENLVADAAAPRIAQWNRRGIGLGVDWVFGESGGRENTSGDKS